jgi:hypothetical protein
VRLEAEIGELESLFIPITSTGVVPSQYLGKMTAWTWLGNNYAVPPPVEPGVGAAADV